MTKLGKKRKQKFLTKRLAMVYGSATWSVKKRKMDVIEIRTLRTQNVKTDGRIREITGVVEASKEAHKRR